MFVEEFIKMVKARPCLYDYRDPFSKNKKEKAKNWAEVASALNITGEVARNKWRNLKDTYSKHLKSIRTMPSSKYIHWTWAPHMEFMKEHLCLATSNIEYHNSLDSNEIDDLDTQTQSSSRSDDTDVVSKRRRRNHGPSRTDEHDLGSDNLFQYIENNQNNSYDATELIFLGYAKSIKSFSVRRQALIKMKIAKIIMEEEVADYEETLALHESPDYSYLQSPQHDPLTPKIEIMNSDE